jgi:hypothetical protein
MPRRTVTRRADRTRNRHASPGVPPSAPGEALHAGPGSSAVAMSTNREPSGPSTLAATATVREPSALRLPGQAPLTCRHTNVGIRCDLILVPSPLFPGYLQHLVAPAIPHYPDPMRVSSSASRTSGVPELVMASQAPGPQALLGAEAALEESPA